MSHAAEQLILRQAIDRLGKLDPDLLVATEDGRGIVSVDSYRGYYEQLSLEPGGDPITVRSLGVMLSKAWGETFHGYKGGDYLMRGGTPLWVAPYGCTGPALVGFIWTAGTNRVRLVTEEVEW